MHPYFWTSFFLGSIVVSEIHDLIGFGTACSYSDISLCRLGASSSTKVGLVVNNQRDQNSLKASWAHRASSLWSNSLALPERLTHALLPSLQLTSCSVPNTITVVHLKLNYRIRYHHLVLPHSAQACTHRRCWRIPSRAGKQTLCLSCPILLKVSSSKHQVVSHPALHRCSLVLTSTMVVNVRLNIQLISRTFLTFLEMLQKTVSTVKANGMAFREQMEFQFLSEQLGIAITNNEESPQLDVSP